MKDDKSREGSITSRLIAYFSGKKSTRPQQNTGNTITFEEPGDIPGSMFTGFDHTEDELEVQEPAEGKPGEQEPAENKPGEYTPAENEATGTGLAEEETPEDIHIKDESIGGKPADSTCNAGFSNAACKENSRESESCTDSEETEDGVSGKRPATIQDIVNSTNSNVSGMDPFDMIEKMYSLYKDRFKK